MELPRFFALKSNNNNKYLRQLHEPGPTQGFIQATRTDLTSEYIIFELENAKSRHKMVHIKSPLNNKYWRTLSLENPWIVADADKPEEDQSSGTMFEIMDIDVNGVSTTVRLRHVHLGHYACVKILPNDAKNLCLFAESATPKTDLTDVFTMIASPSPKQQTE